MEHSSLPESQQQEAQSQPYYPPDNRYLQPPQPDPNPNPHANAPPAENSQMPAAAAAAEQPASSGLNHVVAAVTMDAADLAMQERLWHEGSNDPCNVCWSCFALTCTTYVEFLRCKIEAGRPPYRRGGRRGGGLYRGGGRFGHRPPTRADGGAPPFRGRGRMGRGRGRRFPMNVTATAAPSSPSQHPGSTSDVVQRSAPAPAPASKPSKAPRPPPQVCWCEICMVECNSLEILEQHKNGKRHKKTLQRYEELQKLKKAESESQGMAIVQSEDIHGIDENMTALEKQSPKDSAPESSLAVAIMDGNKMDLEQQNQTAEQPEVAKVDPTEAPAPERKRKMGNWRYPPKQKMKFGRGAKHQTPSEAGHNSEGPKEQMSRYCALCNVTCDTQAVFEVHLAGKKHTSRAKRFPAPQGGYGAMGAETVATQYNPAPTLETAFYGAMGVETVATQYNPVPTLESAFSGSGYIYMPGNYTVPAPEYGVPLAANVILPGLDVKAAENGSWPLGQTVDHGMHHS